MPRIKGLKQGLAGALALAAAAAVPTVVASSQAQQVLAPWQPGGAGGGSAEAAVEAAGDSAAAPPDWSLSRVLEEVLLQVRQLALGGSEVEEEAGSEEAEEEGWEDEVPAAHAAGGHCIHAPACQASVASVLLALSFGVHISCWS